MRFCFLLLFGLIFTVQASWAQSLVWAKSSKHHQAVIDKNGNSYVAGTFTGTQDFNPSPSEVYNLTAEGTGYNFFVCKLNAQGNFLWAKKTKSSVTGYVDIQDFAVDSSGNIFITGDFTGAMHINQGTPTATQLVSAGQYEDMFICKFDHLGNFAWAKSVGGLGGERGWNVAIAPDQSVYVSGTFTSRTDFDPSPSATYTLNPTGWDIHNGYFCGFLLKLTSTGQFIYVKPFFGNFVYPLGIAINPQGIICITGSFSGTMDCNPDPNVSNEITSIIQSNGYDNGYVLQLNDAGIFLWASAFKYGSAHNVAFDYQGNTYVAGYLNGTMYANTLSGIDTLVAKGPLDILIIKFNTAGQMLWAKTLGGQGSDMAWSIAIDTEGNVYTTGYFEGLADFDPSKTTTYLLQYTMGNYLRNIFVSKLSTNGDFIWAGKIASPYGFDCGYNIHLDRFGYVYVAGQTGFQAIYSPSYTSNYPMNDVDEQNFIAKIWQCLPPKIVGKELLCANSPSTLSIANPNPNASYIWSNGQTGTKITVNTLGDYYAQTVAHGCTSSVSNTIKLVAMPIPVVSGGSSLCDGRSTTLSIENPVEGFSYVWSNGQIGNSVIISTQGSFSARAFNNACTSGVSNAIEILPKESPTQPIIEGDTLLCTGESTILSIKNPQAAVQYFWSNGETGNSISVGVSGVISVRGVMAGCTSLVSSVVVAYIPNTAQAGADTNICTATTLALPLLQNATWTTEIPLTYPDVLQGNQLTLFNETETPKTINCIARVQNEHCIYYDTLRVSVHKMLINTQGNFVCGELLIPNVLTPNEDGKNDTFFIKGLPLFNAAKLVVYDRWGKMLYQDDHYTNQWNGGNLESGTYFYYLELNTTLRTKTFKGWVEVLK